MVFQGHRNVLGQVRNMREWLDKYLTHRMHILDIIKYCCVLLQVRNVGRTAIPSGKTIKTQRSCLLHSELLKTSFTFLFFKHSQSQYLQFVVARTNC